MKQQIYCLIFFDYTYKKATLGSIDEVLNTNAAYTEKNKLKNAGFLVVFQEVASYRARSYFLAC